MERLSEDEAVTAAEDFLTESLADRDGYEVVGVLDYTKFGKWRVVFDVDNQGSAKVDVDDETGEVVGSENL